MSAALLERLILESWPARERADMHGWALLSDAGVTGRANAVAPLAYDGGDVAEAIAAATAWQTARGNRPCFKIADSVCAPSSLAQTLAAQGWAPHTPTLVMTAHLDEALAHLPAAREAVTLTPDFVPAIDAIVRDTAASDAEYAERSAIAARTPQPRRFAILSRADATAAVGLVVITEGWAAIFLMRTHPAHRRQGLARDILGALLNWAHGAGATQAYLQVEAANAPAIALYKAAAFETAYSYAYWRPETKT